MGRAIAAISSQAVALLPRPALLTRIPIAETLRRIAHEMLHPYHPERHYMRGPGPKWRAKHGLDAGL